MSRTPMRLVMLLCLVAVVTAAAAPISSAVSPNGAAVNEVLPCDPVIERTITPLIVEQGGEVTVQVKYNFKCTGLARKIDFFLVVENTSALRPGASLNLLNNLKLGLKNFVNQVNYNNGSRGGLTLYALDYTNRVTLQGEERGREALLHAIGTISVEPIGAISGPAGAIRDTTQRLEEATLGDYLQVLLIVDSGAPYTASGPQLSDLATACQLAKDAKIYMIVVGLRPAGNRLGSYNCISPGGFYYSPAEDGSDLPDIFNRVAENLVKGKAADEAEYYDQLNGVHFQYVPGSAAPEEPQQLRPGEYSWRFPPPGPFGQVIQYRARVSSESVPVGGVMTNLSDVSQLYLYYRDNTTGQMNAPNPDICIYRKGHPEDCQGYAATLTPPGPTNTPGPTEPPTDMPSPSPTDTPVPATATPTAALAPRFELCLPALLRTAGF